MVADSVNDKHSCDVLRRNVSTSKLHSNSEDAQLDEDNAKKESLIKLLSNVSQNSIAYNNSKNLVSTGTQVSFQDE